MSYSNISALLGKTLTNIENDTGDALVFHTSDGEVYAMSHDQTCCENVSIEDIAGDMADLIGSPIVQAEEVSSSDVGFYEPKSNADLEQWTFYKLATNRGGVTIRWYGSSNGYYAVDVNFYRVR